MPETTDHPGRDRRGRQGRLHRPGGRAAGALRQHHERDAPGGRPHRRRRGDGLEEPQGRRGVRAAAPSRSPTPRPSRPPSMKARHMIKTHPVGGAGLKAYGTDVLINILNETGGLPDPELPGRVLPDRRQGRRRVAGRQAADAAQGLLLLHHQLRPGDQGQQPELCRASARGPSTKPPGPSARTAASTISTPSRRPTTSATSTAWTRISMGSTIACAMELFERGIITTKDTDGVALRFGNAEAMVEMTRKAGRGRGLRQEAGPGLLPAGGELRPSGVFDDLQEAGDARLRSARRAGHRAQLRHEQPRRLPRPRLHDRGRGPAERRRDRPARHRGQGAAGRSPSRT